MGNPGTEWLRYGEYGWECEEWDGNGDGGNQRGNAGNLGDNAKMCGISVAMQGTKMETYV